jgi:hypothetical protein
MMMNKRRVMMIGGTLIGLCGVELMLTGVVGASTIQILGGALVAVVGLFIGGYDEL